MVKIISKFFNIEGADRIEVYIQNGGYQALKKALKELQPSQIIDEVKKANLRGRGGAGFPAGVKWGFVPKDVPPPYYLTVNADEGEPGTFKDRYILEKCPHLLIEGIIITCFANRINLAYIYIRGEWEMIARKLESAIDEAYKNGFLGSNILNSGFSLDLYVHRGAGAYICGEETALLESLEGKRGLPRLKPPFPASKGFCICPTIINNVETLANIPSIITNGGEWFASLGVPKDGGLKLFPVSGHVNKPGVYELPIGTNLKEIIFEHAGGIRNGKKLKAVIPGGLSAPILRAEEIDIPMDFASLQKAESMLGSGAVIVMDEDTSIAEVLRIILKFFSDESCGQCTPCRVGTHWMRRTWERVLDGKGREEDLDEIVRICDGMLWKCFCPLGDACALQVQAVIHKFRPELKLGGELGVRLDF